MLDVLVATVTYAIQFAFIVSIGLGWAYIIFKVGNGKSKRQAKS